MSEFCESRNGGWLSVVTQILPLGQILPFGPIVVAIGANLPGPDGRPPIETCRDAVVCLSRLQGLRLQALSRWYVSAPVPPSGQPDYINAVAMLAVAPDTAIEPAWLLGQLMAIEAQFGRTRSETNAARTLDLDLIGMGSLVRTSSDPILPHPRAHERRFVLAPLVDIAPDWVHPLQRQTARELLAAG